MAITGGFIMRIIQKTKGKPKTEPDTAGEAALQALEHLEQRMKQVSEESNKFANQYRFGGMVAIIALLNADLLIDKSILRISWSVSDWRCC